MFERYTESARRALFFARHEVSGLGVMEIGAEHLLLGLMHEASGLVSEILAPVSLEKIRDEIKSKTHLREKIPTSVEIPFTAEAKRVLNVAAEEADRLLHSYIGPEHLVLALLREEQSVAARILHLHGLQLSEVRLHVAQSSEETRNTSAATPREVGSVRLQRHQSRAQIFEQIERIDGLVEQLGRRPPDTDEARVLVARIRDELNALRQHI